MSTAAYADTIKVGVVGPFSGPFALQGKNFKAGIDAYMTINGNKIGDNTVEVIYRDLPAADPAQSKALAQELVVKEKVQYLAGFYFTPDAMAVTPILKQANTPLVIMNAATSAIVTKSPLVVRTSFTTWQTSTPIAKVAHDAGVAKVISVVSDYGPGVDAENAFKAAFEKEGGQVVEAIRMPLSTNDFSPIMQRIKDSGAKGVFAFLPSGPTTLGFVKAYNENGLKDAGIKFFAPGDLTQESDLHKGLGYVPQARCVFPTLTVEENLFVGLKGRAKTALEEAYDMFPRLKERRRNLGNQLSGGEQQMLSTARTILGRPSVLLLDEPLEGLAPVICEELMAAFAELAKTGDMTILLVEQRIQSALDFADHVIVLERGRLAWAGTPKTLSDDQDAVERLLGVGGLH
ncbi:ABC transporter substrate-binding protein [Rhizobium favelukesii]|nr:ABC transporter substrate-binding protein [Rhizobium favelukesii]MCS0458322.1 ABC transporter substrate-binding protein [Rhizobium favelukesii]